MQADTPLASSNGNPPTSKGVFAWIITPSYAGPLQVGTIVSYRGTSSQAVAYTLDGQALSVDDCMAALAHPSAEQRLAATCFVATFGMREALLPLSGLLSDLEPLVRRHAAYAIVQLVQRHPYSIIGGQHTHVRRPDASQRETARDECHISTRLIHTLTNDDRATAAYAAKALGFWGDPQAIDALLQALTNGHESLQEAAAGALGNISPFGEPRVLAALLTAPHTYIRDGVYPCRLGHRSDWFTHDVKNVTPFAPLISSSYISPTRSD